MRTWNPLNDVKLGLTSLFTCFILNTLTYLFISHYVYNNSVQSRFNLQILVFFHEHNQVN